MESLENGLFADLLLIGKNLSLSKTLTKQELQTAKDYHSKINGAINLLNPLWDNLIYQFITQKNFYVKEAIAHILNGFHVGYVQSLTLNEELKSINDIKNFETITSFTNATIVLPFEIFEENTSAQSFEGKASAENLSNRENNFLKVVATKNQTEQNNAFERDNFVNLKAQLQTILKKHSTAYQKEYKTAYQKYSTDNAEIIKIYDEQGRIIAELEKSL